MASCSSEESGEVKQSAKHTVMVYMSAENVLSSYAQPDINEMISGAQSISKWDNLLVFVDRAKQSENPFIIRIKPVASTDEQPVDTIKKYDTDFLASDPERMQEVLNWCMKEYPAEDYGLVLWGHADGWIIHADSLESNRGIRRAFGVDNGANKNSDEGTWLNIASLRVVLESLPEKLKFVFCDCCNMQCAEVAYELKDATDYIIAAPSEIPGDGAPYEKVIADLFSSSSNDIEKFSKLCDDYSAVPISVVRTEYMPLLADATRDVLSTFWGKTTITPEEDKLIYYYHYRNNSDEHVMFDMNDFIRTYADASDYATWHSVFMQAVPYCHIATSWQANFVNFSYFTVTEEKMGGMSMFFPMTRYENITKNYNELIQKTAWYHAVWSGLD